MQGKKQIEKFKEKLKYDYNRLHAKLTTIKYNNYFCSKSILQNGHQHNSPQFQVQLEATYEFFF